MAAIAEGKKEEKVVVQGTPETPPMGMPEPDSVTEGVVHAGGQAIAYQATAGTLTVGATDSYDSMLGLDGKLLPDSGVKPADKDKPEEAPATARIFYTYYVEEGRRPARCGR